MTTLSELLAEHQRSRGMGRLIVQAQIRQYVASSSVPNTLDEIGHIWEEESLNALIGAGMRGVLYYKVLEQKAKLAGL